VTLHKAFGYGLDDLDEIQELESSLEELGKKS
jgi:hypothetical protein